MIRWFRQLDQILRGELTRPDSLRGGRFQFSLTGVSAVAVVLAMIYGACIGAYSIFRIIDQAEFPASYRQMLASTVKTPALFFLTLLITFPSLYVFNALVGSRLRITDVARLLIASLGINLAVLASLGPIVAFFSLSTNSYAFMVLLNVGVFAASGFLGLIFLVQTMNRLQYAERELTAVAAPAEASPSEIPSPLALPPGPPAAVDRIAGHVFGGHVKLVFGIWIVVFGLVGAQMGWNLRPFIGSPTEDFRWFRQRESNFFQALGNVTAETFEGNPAQRSTRSEPSTYELDSRSR
ncbi:MAG: hypothetical protein QM775_03200 [Pirellulales bacterium]